MTVAVRRWQTAVRCQFCVRMINRWKRVLERFHMHQRRSFYIIYASQFYLFCYTHTYSLYLLQYIIKIQWKIVNLKEKNVCINKNERKIDDKWWEDVFYIFIQINFNTIETVFDGAFVPVAVDVWRRMTMTPIERLMKAATFKWILNKFVYNI